MRKRSITTGYKGNIAWAPDGEHVAYIGYESKEDPWVPRHSRLWVVPVRGGSAQCLTDALDRTVGNMIIGDTREFSEGGQRPAARQSLPTVWSGII